jgi:hypothetical protein
MATNPKRPYRMKKPRPSMRPRPILTLDQHAHSQRITRELEAIKQNIVVTALMWSELHSSAEKINLLAELRRCTDHYKDLMTFPKHATEVDE